MWCPSPETHLIKAMSGYGDGDGGGGGYGDGGGDGNGSGGGGYGGGRGYNGDTEKFVTLNDIIAYLVNLHF